MKLSKDKLNQLIESYLNDVEDYGEGIEYTLAENTLKPFQKLITESKTSLIDLLEMKKQALDEEIVDDFILYIQNS
jgi:hypothetical protein